MEQLSLQNLTFYYPNQPKPVLSDLTFSVRAGEFITLCGPSGCGKSTLLRHLKPALTPSGARTGVVLFEGQPIETVSQREQSAKIGFVHQSPENQIVTDKVWHELAFGLESLGFDTPAIRRRVAEMASFFGIQAWFYRDVSTLSGGQKQVLNLASVLAMGPSVLILDEPTSQLDPIAAANFLELLGKINRELGTTILLSEHRLEEAFPRSDRVLVLDQGRLLCSGTPADVGETLRRLHHPMTAALPAPMRVWAAAPREGPCPITVREGRDWLAEYAARHTLHPLPPETIPELGEEVLSARGVFFRYERDLPDVLKGFDLSLRKGEILALLGGNGAGKTTALGLLGGLYPPQRGKVQAVGRVSLLPQDPQTVFLKKTVREDLLAQLRQGRTPRETWDRRVSAMAELCHLTGLLDRHPYDLSGGEQQRAALARILLTEPDILLLDEPTKGLDAPLKQTVAQILHQLTRQGVSVVLVSHDADFCAEHAHRCALFFDGAVVAEDLPNAFFSGSSFYTTAVNRMAREQIPQAVTAADVIQACGGRLPAGPPQDETKPAPPSEDREEAPQTVPPNPASPARHRRSRRTILSMLFVFLLIPLTVYWGSQALEGRKYYFISLLVLLEVLVLFGLSFEGRKPQARELVLLSSLCALGVIGRAAFVMLPQCKPVTALTILTGTSLGKEAGFLVGAATMLVSNLLFGQGPWTPWQMFAMGLIGFLAGILFRNGRLRRSPLRLGVFGFLAALILYGGVMNAAAALMWVHTLNLELLLSYCFTGLPMDLVHAGTTAVFLLLLTDPILEKLQRIQTKYGLKP